MSKLRPLYSPTTQPKMTAASFLPPHGRSKRDSSVRVLRKLPDRRRVGNEIQVQDLPTAARTRHRGRPSAAGILDYVNRSRREAVGFVVDALYPEAFTLDRLAANPGPKGPPPPTDCAQNGFQTAHPVSWSLSSGRLRRGVTSPFPTWRLM